MSQKGLNEQTKISKRNAGFGMKWGTLITIAVLFVFFTFANWSKDTNSSMFLTRSNLTTIIRSISITAVIAIGLTFSLSINGMDMSIGSVANFSNAFIMTMMIWYQVNLGLSILLTIIACLAIGALTSFLIVKLKIPDMIATLSVLYMIQGAALTYTHGSSVSERMPLPDGTPSAGLLPKSFRAIGIEPGLIIVMLAVVLLAFFFLNYTKHGRYMYAVGGNMEAARLSGISVTKYRVLAYLLSAGLAGLGGILLGARVGSSQVNAGAAYLMPAAAAAFIGFSIAGAGKANALGTLAGAFLVGMLENGLVMMSVPYHSMDIVKGAVLALALAMTYSRKKA